MTKPEVFLHDLQTYEEMRMQVDKELYGITDDPSVPYPWNKPDKPNAEPKPIITEEIKLPVL